jgi:hypothetical protein
MLWWIPILTQSQLFFPTEVEPFSSKYMTGTILNRLLMQQNIVQNISFEEYSQKDLTLYSTGRPATFFCLVLEGCVEVEIGKDNLKFESRAFSYFGHQALMLSRDSPGSEYRADFTARPLMDCLLVIISQAQYMAARRASVFEGEKANGSMSNQPGPGSNSSTSAGSKSDVFSAEWAKAETLNVSNSQKKGSFFQLGFSSKSLKQSKVKSSDEMQLLARGDSDSSPGSSGRASPVGVRTLEAGTETRTPQARTTGGDLSFQSSQV